MQLPLIVFSFYYLIIIIIIIIYIKTTFIKSPVRDGAFLWVLLQYCQTDKCGLLVVFISNFPFAFSKKALYFSMIFLSTKLVIFALFGLM
jgi:hypothetical protein